jgi:hypothetical protein
MRYCKNCHIHYDTPLEKCMFCNDDLKATGETTYKFAPYKKKGLFHHFYRFFIFINFISLALSIFLDYDHNGFPLTWSLLVGSSNILAVILFTLFANSGLWIAKVNKAVFSGLVWITFVTYILGDYHWAVDYIIPISISFNISLLTILLVFDRKKWFDYSLGLFFFATLGLLPGLFNLLDLTLVKWPSAAAVIYSIITFIGLFFFSSKETKDEFKRRFHI